MFNVYQTWHAGSRTIACGALHPNAFWNSGMFEITPLMRKRNGEWTFVCHETEELARSRVFTYL